MDKAREANLDDCLNWMEHRFGFKPGHLGNRERIATILKSYGYLHKDDPITRTRKCDDCGGTGVISILADSQLREYKPRKLETCPSCHDGEIVEQWVVDIIEQCKYRTEEDCNETYECCNDYDDLCNRKTGELPVTHGNAHLYMDKEGKWRKVCI